MSKAGVLGAIVTTQAPADGAPTDKRKGYHWFEYVQSSESPDLTGLLMYQDFDTDREELSNGFMMVQNKYGRGVNDGLKLSIDTLSGDTIQDSPAGMHNNHAALCNGTGAYHLVEDDTQLRGDTWTIDEHTQIFVFNPTVIGTLFGLSASGNRTSGGQNPHGYHTMVNADGTVRVDIGDFGFYETLTSTSLVVVDKWNMVIVTHNPATKTIGISISNEDDANANLPEDLVYTATFSSFVAPLSIYTGFNGGVTDPMPDQSRLVHYSLFNHVVPYSELNLMHNGGAWLSTPGFFGVESDVVGKGVLGIGNKARPDLDFDIAYEWSVYTSTTVAPPTAARTDGDVPVGYLSRYMGNPHTSTSGSPVIRTNRQNGLTVVEILAGAEQNAGFSVGSGGALAVSLFFAGSVTNSATGWITRFFSGRCRFTCNDTGVIGYDNGEGGVLFADVSDAVGSGVFFIGAVTYDASIGEIKTFMNGALSSTLSITPIATGGSLGGRIYSDIGGGNPFTGEMGRLIALREALSEADVITVMGEMNEEWAVY